MLPGAADRGACEVAVFEGGVLRERRADEATAAGEEIDHKKYIIGCQVKVRATGDVMRCPRSDRDAHCPDAPARADEASSAREAG